MHAHHTAKMTAVQVVSTFNRQFIVEIDEMRKEIYLKNNLNQLPFLRRLSASLRFLENELTQNKIEILRTDMLADLYPLFKDATPALIENSITAIMNYVTHLVLKGHIRELKDLKSYTYSALLIESLRKSDVTRFNRVLIQKIEEPAMDKILKQRAEEAECGDRRQLYHGISVWHRKESMLSEQAYLYAMNESFESTRVKL